jgi:hypothetical protein
MALVAKTLAGFLIALCLSFESASAATTHYVPDDFATIQAALDMATNGDMIVVRDGTYAGAGNKNLDFDGKAIYLRSENGPANCIIDCQHDGRAFAFHSGETPESVLDGFTITKGLTQYSGVFPDGWGAGILCYRSSPTIKNCVITGNQSIGTDSGSGAGISCYLNASPIIVNCLVASNSGVWGGGIYCNFSSSPNISNCTITGNFARGGGGIYTANQSWPTITDSILWDNSATYGLEIEVVQDSDLTVAYSDVKGGPAAALVQSDSTLHWDVGNIVSDPFFIFGPLGEYYLSQSAASQPADSPCVNAGSDTAANLGLAILTTRTDHVPDTDTADMGYHYGRDSSLTRISLVSPSKLSTLSAPPAFSWRALGGEQNSFAIDLSLLPGFKDYWSTHNNLHETIQAESWTMPLSVWNMIPSGTRVYWRVRGADLSEDPLRIIRSNQIWSFIKQ